VVLIKFTFHDIAITNKYDLPTKAMMVKTLLEMIMTLMKQNVTMGRRKVN
jgi:hypothetical protein